MHASAWTARPGLLFSGGAADEIMLRANCSAWDGLTPAARASLVLGFHRTILLGRTLAHPILLAPVVSPAPGHPGMGERASAYAAAALGPMVLSTQASTPLEEVAQIFWTTRGVACQFQPTCSTTGLYPHWCSAPRPQATKPWC